MAEHLRSSPTSDEINMYANVDSVFFFRSLHEPRGNKKTSQSAKVTRMTEERMWSTKQKLLACSLLATISRISSRKQKSLRELPSTLDSNGRALSNSIRLNDFQYHPLIATPNEKNSLSHNIHACTKIIKANNRKAS